MAVSDEEIAFAKDLFAGLGTITTRKMMGGLCLYYDSTIFAILHPDAGIMIKGSGAFQTRLEAMGCKRWTYKRAAKSSGRGAGTSTTAMPYWTLPDGMEDDPDAAVALARDALAHL